MTRCAGPACAHPTAEGSPYCGHHQAQHAAFVAWQEEMQDRLHETRPTR